MRDGGTGSRLARLRLTSHQTALWKKCGCFSVRGVSLESACVHKSVTMRIATFMLLQDGISQLASVHTTALTYDSSAGSLPPCSLSPCAFSMRDPVLTCVHHDQACSCTTNTARGLARTSET
eukprot:987997-Rhodomonas_salina.2